MSRDRPNVVLDRATCIGSQTCVLVAPRIFTTGDEGLGRVKDDHDGAWEDYENAAANCPVSAISVARAAADDDE
ncbi:ferredoxin [Pseudonocardia oroxyli]|uniref:ferredoxin n=1 Tax=Pseudonocardia oroxyli TaxID=366584 RepID=UPI000B883107